MGDRQVMSRRRYIQTEAAVPLRLGAHDAGIRSRLHVI